MVKSLLLALFILVLALFCAWAVVHFGKKAGERPGKLKGIAWGFVLGGLAFSAYAFFVDFGQRQVTLFEALLPGTKNAGLPAVRTASFTFEHTDVEHTLLVFPKPAFAESVSGTASAHVSLVTEDGETLIAEGVTFTTYSEHGKDGVPREVWNSHSWRFRPTRLVRATLTLRLETPGIHEVLVRVEDPEKQDGRRAEGY